MSLQISNIADLFPQIFIQVGIRKGGHTVFIIRSQGDRQPAFLADLRFKVLHQRLANALSLQGGLHGKRV